jgi:phosphoglycolate phosphatase
MSKAKLKAKGIFFDLDGTIVDSRDAYIAAAKTAFKTIGQKPPKAKTALEIPRRLEQNQPINDLVKTADIHKFLDVYLRTYYAISAEKTKPIPNIATTLETLSKKAKLALITMRSVPKKAITAELEHFGIAKHFTHIVTAQDTHKPKPSPEALINVRLHYRRRLRKRHKSRKKRRRKNHRRPHRTLHTPRTRQRTPRFNPRKRHQTPKPHRINSTNQYFYTRNIAKNRLKQLYAQTK